MIQNRIDSDVAVLKRVILDLDSSGVDYCVNDVINRYKSPQSHILVLDYMHSQIEQLRASNRLGTAKNYEKTMTYFCNQPRYGPHLRTNHADLSNNVRKFGD